MAIPLNVGASQLNVQSANRYATDGRYEFLRELGEGAFGKVFLAADRRHGGNRVAVKLISIPTQNRFLDYLSSVFGIGGSRLNEAKREASLLRQLRHDYVIGFIDSFKFETGSITGVGIVMRFCSGGNLADYLIKEGRPSEKQRLEWSSQLAAGMEFLHSEGVTHRDLKPDNILIDEDGCLKIADIGLAKVVWDVQQSTGKAADMTLDQYLTSVKGTKAYVAPEVCTGHYTNKCDVFSLGLVFVAMIEVPITGSFVLPLATWRGEKVFYGLLLHQDTSARQTIPSALIPLHHATVGERRLIDEMLLFDWKDRPSMEDVVSSLKSLKASLSYFESRIVLVRDPPPEKSGCCS
jgi:serine/threonine protein kinase